jgi:predicted DNA-binding protein YlxM (UPF0122 family)
METDKDYSYLLIKREPKVSTLAIIQKIKLLPHIFTSYENKKRKTILKGMIIS